MSGELELLSRFAAGDADAEREALLLFRQALKTWIRQDYGISLERCLKVDAVGRRQQAIAKRNYWLTVAHGLCEGPTPWAKSCQLKAELARFETAIWPAWRADDKPPEGASQLREALFSAYRSAAKTANARGMVPMPETNRMLHAIVKSKPDEISQRDMHDDHIGQVTTRPADEREEAHGLSD